MGKKSSPPPPPDYAQLALQQAQIDQATAGEQTSVNRPQQYTPYGQSEWFQNDLGDWAQVIGLNPADQQLLDNSRVLQGTQQGVAYDLMGNIGDTLRTPISLEGLPEIQGYDLSKLIGFADPNDISSLDFSKLPELGDAGFGGVQEVQDAMMGRLAPLRAQSRDSEIQRLKNQGLSEDSAAFQRALTRLDQGDTDAQQQALLKSMDAYNDIYGRQLAGRASGLTEQQADINNQRTIQGMIAALRGQQFGEQGAMSDLTGRMRQQALTEGQMVRDAPLNDYLRLVAGTSPGPLQMPSFMGGTPYSGPNMLGAADRTYQAQVGNTNASNAQGAGLTQGLFTIAGGILGGPMGAALGSGLGTAIAS